MTNIILTLFIVVASYFAGITHGKYVEKKKKGLFGDEHNR